MSTESNTHPCKFSISCWNCRQQKAMEAAEMPQFGFEVAQAAEAAGWKGIHDSRCGRILIFCSEECFNACLLKSGHIRRFRPKEGALP